MWGEFCDTYAPNNEESDRIDFLEAIEYILKGEICKDFNGRAYKIENREFYWRRYGSWIKCFNYEIPTTTEWKLVK